MGSWIMLSLLDSFSEFPQIESCLGTGSLFNFIIGLFWLDMIWPKVITLSGAYCKIDSPKKKIEMFLSGNLFAIVMANDSHATASVKNDLNVPKKLFQQNLKQSLNWATLWFCLFNDFLSLKKDNKS